MPSVSKAGDVSTQSCSEKCSNTGFTNTGCEKERKKRDSAGKKLSKKVLWMQIVKKKEEKFSISEWKSNNISEYYNKVQTDK